MAISVKKLSGEEIPEHLRAQDPTADVVFQVEGADGQIHYRHTDVAAAALAVELSEQEKHDSGGD
ncbi:MAG: hypothetical protein ACRYF9_24505 [Janthinobacterium lividum]|uniref:hypothetical protein n=1 Tax=Pseudomonas sp. MWU16-30317 TaxID=2878095 RepID=UPI001CFB88A7|nr:hypothetical protein [Pseudomonas sp. MWU16-30317]